MWCTNDTSCTYAQCQLNFWELSAQHAGDAGHHRGRHQVLTTLLELSPLFWKFFPVTIDKKKREITNNRRETDSRAGTGGTWGVERTPDTGAFYNTDQVSYCCLFYQFCGSGSLKIQIHFVGSASDQDSDPDPTLIVYKKLSSGAETPCFWNV